MSMIEIKCKGTDTVPLRDIKDFQGNLKTITPENLDKLKRSIKKHGFTAPIFVWEHEGVKHCIDGHSRIKALIDLEDEGIKIPKIPVAYIYADNEKDAREKLLYITSQYGEFDRGGFLDFSEGLQLDEIRIVDKEYEILAEDIIYTEPKEIELQQYEKIHYLISFAPSIYPKIASLIEKIKEFDVEVEQSAN